MKHFTYKPENWTLQNDERLSLSHISSRGDTVRELMDNAEISIIDWHGNEGPDYGLWDLGARDLQDVLKLFEDFIKYPEEYV